MPEDSAASAVHPPVPDHQVDPRSRFWFKPGQSGNPLGYQAPLRSFASHIRQETGYGSEIAAFYLAVMRGEVIKMPGKRITRRKNGRKIASIYVRPTLDQRIDAAAWLADRGWGKAKETIELTGEASPAQRLELLRRLSEDEREQLRGLLARALNPPRESLAPDANNQDASAPLLQTPDSVDSRPVPQLPAEPTE